MNKMSRKYFIWAAAKAVYPDVVEARGLGAMSKFALDSAEALVSEFESRYGPIESEADNDATA